MGLRVQKIETDSPWIRQEFYDLLTGIDWEKKNQVFEYNFYKNIFFLQNLLWFNSIQMKLNAIESGVNLFIKMFYSINQSCN